MKNTRIYLFIEFFAILFLSALVLLLYRFDQHNEVQVADAAPLVSVDTSFTHTASNDSLMTYTNSFAGTEKLVLVSISYRVTSGNNAGDMVYSVYDYTSGSSLTKACRDQNGGYATEIWYLTDASSSYDIETTWNNTVDDMVTTVTILTGASLDNPIRGSECSNGESFSPAGTIDSNNDDLVFAATATYTGDFNQVDEGTVDMTRVNQASATNVIQTTSVRDGVSTVGMNWDQTSSWPWSVAIVSLSATDIAGQGTDTVNPQFFYDGNYTDYVSFNYDSTGQGDRAVYVQIAFGGGSYYNEYVTDVFYDANVYDYSICSETMYGNYDNYNVASYLFINPTSGSNNLEVYFSGTVGEISIYAVTVENVDFSSSYYYDYYCESTFGDSISLGYSGASDDIFSVGGLVTDEIFHSVSAINNTQVLDSQPISSVYNHTLGSSDAYLDFSLDTSVAYAGSSVMFYANTGPADTNGPEFSTNLPTNYPYINSSFFTFESNISDPDGIEYVYYDDEDTSGNLLSFDSGSQGDSDIYIIEDFGPYSDGQKTFTITAEDSIGNLNDEVLLITLDTTLPEITFSEEPDQVNPINNTSVSFEGEVTDATSPIDFVAYTLDGGLQQEITGQDDDSSEFISTFAFNVSDLENGQHTVEFYAGDAAFNADYIAAFTFDIQFVDTYPECVFDVITTPTNDTTPTFTGTCTDPLGVDKIHHRIYNTSLGDIVAFPNVSDPTTVNLTSGNWGDENVSFSFTSPPLVDGSYLTYIRAFNTPGGYGGDDLIPEVLVDIEAIDNAAPTVFLNQIVPDPIVDTTPIITGTCGDEHPFQINTNISTIDYRVNGGGWNNIPASAIQGDNAYNSTVEIYSYEIPELVLGSYTVDVRCIDSNANTSTNASDSFEIVAMTEGDPTEPVVTEDFTSQLRNAVSATNAIWGNGIVRLKEDIDVSRVAIDTTNFKPLYDRTFNIGAYVLQQGTGDLVWYTKRHEFVSYNTQTAVTQTYDAVAMGLDMPITNIAQTTFGGNIYVFATADDGLLVFNVTDNLFTIYDGPGFDSDGYAPNDIWIDTRSATLGIYVRTNVVNLVDSSNLVYINLNGTVAEGDDVVTWYASAAGVPMYAVVSLHIDTTNNIVYAGVYDEGLVKISDNNTPNNLGDDTRDMYTGIGFNGNFGIDQDPDTGIVYFIENYGVTDGLYVISDENGTPMDVSDDTVIQLADDTELFNKNVLDIQFIRGREYVGDQLLLTTGDAGIMYFNLNNTPEDQFDDTVISLPLSQGQYPLSMGGLIAGDFDSNYYSTWYVVLDRAGLFRVDVTRGWEAANQAIAFTVPPANTAAVNNIELVSLDIIDRIDENGVSDPLSNATVETYISIDDGLNWTPIEVGEIIQLPEIDYRVRFRMDLIENPGTTPVVDSFSMTYAAYEDPDEPITVEEYELIADPDDVETGEDFDLTINAVDSLGYVVTTHTDSVDLELLNSPGLTSASGLNVSGANLVNGTVTLNNVTIDTEGAFVIRADDGTLQGDSNEITVTEGDTVPDDDGEDDGGPVIIDPELPNDGLPSVLFTADEYTVTQGESVTLNWDTENLTTVFIDQGIGLVNPDGSTTVTPQISTQYTLNAFGSNGDLSASLTILVEEPTAEIPPGDDGEPVEDITVPIEDVIVYPGDPIIIQPIIVGPDDPIPVDDPEDNIIPIIIVDNPNDPDDDITEIIIIIGDEEYPVDPTNPQPIEISPEEDTEVDVIVKREEQEDSRNITIDVDTNPAIISVGEDNISAPPGEPVEICWRVDGNPQTVYIEYLDQFVSPVGCFEFIPKENTVIRIIARKGTNEYVKEIVVNINESDVGVSDSFDDFPTEGEEIQAQTVLAPILTAVATFAVIAGVSLIYTASIARGGIVSVIGLLAGILFNRNKKYWGIIFEPRQSMPLPLALVRLIDKEGKNINQSISDFEGKYGFIAGQSGTFTLEVKADGFQSFSKSISVQADQEVVEDIALEKEKSELGGLRALWQKFLPILKTIFTYLMGLLMLVGFVVTVIAFSQNQNTLNSIMLVVYGLLLFLNIYSILSLYTKAKGRVVDSGTKRGLSGVVVRFYEGVSKVSMALTNDKGVIKMNLKPAEYLTIANKEGYNMKRLDKLAVNEQGYITDTITLEKLKEGEKSTSSSPFGGS